MLMSWASLSCQPLRDLFRLVASRRQPQGLPCAHNARWQQHGGWRETEEITERPRQTETPQRNKEAPQWPDHDRKVPAATDPGIYRDGHRVVRWPARPGMCRECVCSPVVPKRLRNRDWVRTAGERRLAAAVGGACGGRLRHGAGVGESSPAVHATAQRRVCARACVCVYVSLETTRVCVRRSSSRGRARLRAPSRPTSVTTPTHPGSPMNGGAPSRCAR